jgi:hypothetical protein
VKDIQSLLVTEDHVSGLCMPSPFLTVSKAVLKTCAVHVFHMFYTTHKYLSYNISALPVHCVFLHKLFHCSCVHAFLTSFAKLLKVTISFIMSSHPPAWNILAPTGQVFMKFGIYVCFENLLKKS